jgi:hypothetical protein
MPMSGKSIAASIVLLRHRSSKRSAAVVRFSVEGDDEVQIQGLRVAPGFGRLKGALLLPQSHGIVQSAAMMLVPCSLCRSFLSVASWAKTGFMTMK